MTFTDALIAAGYVNFTATQAEAVVAVLAFRNCAQWAEDRRSNILYSEFTLIGMLNGLAFTSDKDFLANLDPIRYTFGWTDIVTTTP